MRQDTPTKSSKEIHWGSYFVRLRQVSHIYLKKTRFDLIERIKATLEKLKVTNPDKRFRLITKLENLNISTDSVKFFQIVHNLLSNPIKFTPDNRLIDIIVVEHKKIFTLSIRDNGIGIPSQFHPLLFYRRNISVANVRSVCTVASDTFSSTAISA